MTESYIQVPKDSVGKKMRTTITTVDGSHVHQEVVQVANSSDTILNPSTEEKQDAINASVKAFTTPTTTALTLTTLNTAYKLPTSELANRRTLILYNVSDTDMFIGSSSVTTTNGILLPAGGTMNIDCEKDLYAICGTSGKIINVLELS